MDAGAAYSALRRMESNRGRIRALLEEAAFSYTGYYAGVDDGTYTNVPALEIATKC
jgi:hypothetical protein